MDIPTSTPQGGFSQQPSNQNITVPVRAQATLNVDLGGLDSPDGEVTGHVWLPEEEEEEYPEGYAWQGNQDHAQWPLPDGQKDFSQESGVDPWLMHSQMGSHMGAGGMNPRINPSMGQGGSPGFGSPHMGVIMGDEVLKSDEHEDQSMLYQSNYAQNFAHYPPQGVQGETASGMPQQSYPGDGQGNRGGFHHGKGGKGGPQGGGYPGGGIQEGEMPIQGGYNPNVMAQQNSMGNNNIYGGGYGMVPQGQPGQYQSQAQC